MATIRKRTSDSAEGHRATARKMLKVFTRILVCVCPQHCCLSECQSDLAMLEEGMSGPVAAACADLDLVDLVRDLVTLSQNGYGYIYIYMCTYTYINIYK